MAEKARDRVRVPETIVDDEGYETDGMYKWGGPRARLSATSLEQWVNNYNRDLNQSAVDRIAEFRDILTKVISRYVDGPIASDPIGHAYYDRKLVNLNLSTGSGCYAFHKGIPRHSFLDDATDGIRDLDELTRLIGEDQPSIDRIVRVAIRFGGTFMRMHMRAKYGPHVLSSIKHRKASAKGGKATKKLSADQEEIALKRISEEMRPGVSKTAACDRAAARLYKELGIEVSGKTLSNLLAREPGNR